MRRKKNDTETEKFAGFSGLESGLREFIEKVVDEKNEKLTQQEMMDIVKVLLPDLDKLISEKVKIHLVSIANLMAEKLKPEGE